MNSYLRNLYNSIFTGAGFSNPFEDTTEILPSDMSREERLRRFEEMRQITPQSMVDPVSRELEFEEMQRPPRVLRGQDAIDKVSEMEGRELTLPEKVVIEEEGFVDGIYLDTKGVPTYGVGQTGKYIDMSFSESFKDHEDDARKYIPDYDDLNEEAKAAIMSAAYRGDLQQSPKFRKLFNAGKYEEAADEFLDNDDYRESLREGTGVYKRFNRIVKAIRNLQA